MKSKTKEIKKVEILSTAKILLVIGIIFGIFQGILYFYIGYQARVAYPEVSSISFNDENIAGNVEAMLNLAIIKLHYWNLILMPVVFAIIYFLSGVVSAFAYNIIARYVGGIKVTV